jgi:CheY-like chemotaxis protein
MKSGVVNMPTILIATDNTEDAKEIKAILAEDYQNIFVSNNPETSIQDFESHSPDILVLGFKTLEKAERYYLGLYRLGSLVHMNLHRTLILCNKTEVDSVYKLCKKGYFDDYIQYWPIMYDASRLAMAVSHALRDLANIKSSFSATELATEAVRLSELESLLGWNATQGNQLIEAASHSVTDAEQEIQTSLGRFSQRLTQGDFANLVEIKNAQGLQEKISKLQQEDIHGRFETVNDSIKSLKRLAEEFQQKCEPYLESARALKIMIEKIPVTVLVVDDDEMVHKLFKIILEQEGYKLMLATSGVEALSLLRTQRPNLILMDMMMPDMDGLETTSRIKAAKQFSATPIIMVTSNSERSVITSCLKAGAIDFLVKPFSREILLEKISQSLH